MSGLANRGIESYRRTSVETAAPVDLVVMLYDGAMRFGAEARAALARKDIAGRGQAMSRLLAIVGELQRTLDLERGGAVAESLDRLYAYITERLMEASFRQDAAPLDEALTILAGLREAWVGAAAAAREMK